jgi:hypothetical protein
MKKKPKSKAKPDREIKDKRQAATQALAKVGKKRSKTGITARVGRALS